MKALVLAPLLLLAACPKSGGGDGSTDSTSPPTAEVPPPPQPTTPPPEPTSASRTSPEEHAWLGNWTSKSCGDRDYPRWITLSEGGSIAGQERISPCPPEVACVWSGVVEWKGRFERADGALTLRVTKPDNAPPKMAPLPTKLTWNEAAGAPVGVAGEQRCAYERRK